jgi:hypothetical protein
MTVKELCTALNFKIAVEGAPEKQISTVYCCDLLSIVMGKAPADSAWVTVMGNMNSVAVASLAEIGAIILADGVKPDDNAIKRAEENGINIFLSDQPVFDTALKIHKAIN